ncbi:MAG: class I SAM-dependent methyltransferase [Acidobacteriota bacterium]
MAEDPGFPLAFEGGCTPLLLALFDQTPVVDGARLAIHAADDMMNHFLWNYGADGRGWRLEQALSAYYRSGLVIWEHQRRILEWRFGDLAKVESVLDFASGYGRATRFMIHDLGGDRIWAAEIDPDAVRFQKEILGAHGLLSTPIPEDLACPRRFDAILVSSLFTHLPEATFRRWLKKLWALVAPGGVLAFSVHGEHLLPAGAALAESGIHFVNQSESRLLDTDLYGSTWVNEAFVRGALAELAPGASAALFPRGLANFQDLWVVVDAPNLDFSGLDLRAPLEGFVESCRFEPPRLRLAAWAADRTTGRAPVEAQLFAADRQLASTRDFTPRPEVKELFPSENVAAVGFQLEADWPADLPRASTRLEVRVIDADGRTNTLLSTPCETALLRAARFDAWLGARHQESEQARISVERETERSLAERTERELRARIEAMQASRFWKLRNAWFGIKRGLGLTQET